MPGREPLCHCGLTRAEASSSGRPGPAAPGSQAARTDVRRGALFVTVLATAAAFVALYGVIRRLDRAAAVGAQTPSPLTRGTAVYPALPAIRTVATRAAIPPTLTTIPRRPSTAAEMDWDRATALLDLPLRQIEADASVLELDYRPFAGACLAPPAPARGEWLASLKSAPVIGGVTLREKGATIDCETARGRLVARADRLKSDLDDNERLGRTSGVRPEHWRQLLALHGLEAWPGY